MNTSALHPTPRGSTVVHAQLRAVGLAVRRETILAGLLIAGVTILLVVSHFKYDESISFNLPEIMIPAVLVGLVAPMAVWKGEEPSHRSYLWAMPVDRTRHTLVKVLIGWSWLMGLVAGYLVWALGLALLTGGEVGVQLPLLASEPAVGTEGAVLYGFGWIPAPAWMWLVPLAGATATYLAGTIPVLASDHPWRWLAGVFLGFMLLLGVGVNTGLEQEIASVLEGPYGFEPLFTGLRQEDIVPAVVDGEESMVGLVRPSLSHWAIATLLWGGAALLGVLAAAFRHQER